MVLGLVMKAFSVVQEKRRLKIAGKYREPNEN